ncbi:MAG: hypothetical protein U9P73_06625 [Candidatus Cloacimonadota bacterium]|nr:hypothetical protein [Candidatus Cloacimonadota bacterium]
MQNKINKKISKKLASYNEDSKVKIRVRKLKTKYSAYLDYRKKGKRERKYFGFYLTGLEKDWSSDLKLLKRINELKREEVEKLKLNSNQYSLNSNKLDANFVEYFKVLADKYDGNTKRNWNSVYTHLSRFSNGIMKFSDINEIF